MRHGRKLAGRRRKRKTGAASPFVGELDAFGFAPGPERRLLGCVLEGERNGEG
jgi:hypothetical protein